MGTATGVLPLPAFGSRIAVRTKVDYQNSQEGALVRRAQSGDEAAFREIVERYQSKVFSIIHGIVRQRNDVEDIAQQVFTKVFFSIRNFDFRSSLITWIYKITVNECWDLLRKRKARPLVYESDFSEEQSRQYSAIERQATKGLDTSDRMAMRERLENMLGQLEKRDRAMLISSDMVDRILSTLEPHS